MRYAVSIVVWLAAFWDSNALISGPRSIMLSNPASYSSIYYNNGLPSAPSRQILQQQQQISVRRKMLQTQMARTPELSDWVLNRNGSITGIVKYHPIYDDGDGITTSVLADIKSVGPNQFVTTKSGSAYKLVGEGAAFSKKYSMANTSGNEDTTVKKPTPDVLSNAAAVVTGGFLSFFAGGSPSPTTLPKSPSLSVNKDRAAPPAKQPTQYKDVSGLTFGSGKYLVSGTYKLSTSGKSLIWKAYRANFRGEPTGELITLKMSSDTDALKRECANYEKLKNNLVSRGAFVNKLDYLPDAKSNDRKEYDRHSILVMENGVYNLKEWMSISRGAGLRGKEMRDVAVAAGQCIQAMHSCKLVWTDLKTENFVVVSNPEGSSGASATAASPLIVKGIDVESARPFGETPVDYSPEACPPEFAQAFFAGNALQFSLQPSYDMWSLGMMLFEISTGTPYFFLKPPSVVTKTLSTPSFKPKVNAIQDPKLRNLVEKCLSIDPNERPTITQFLLHPYFTTSGIGPFSF